MSLMVMRRRQRGLSIVELMVGITIGLIIVAGASVLLSNQVVDNRRLVVEAQVQQDLRATADIITRELRRSGAIGVDAQLVFRIWTPGSTSEPTPNDYTATISPASDGTDDAVEFNYYPTGPGTDGPFGFFFDEAAGVIETQIRAGGRQALTDPATIRVTEFEVARLADTQIRIPCTRACPDGTSDCWPTVNVRTLEVRITAESRSTPSIVRSQRARVRVRNDHFEFFDMSSPPTAAVCPP
jgi:type IV pilus assembly protein PilW